MLVHIGLNACVLNMFGILSSAVFLDGNLPGEHLGNPALLHLCYRHRHNPGKVVFRRFSVARIQFQRHISISAAGSAAGINKAINQSINQSNPIPPAPYTSFLHTNICGTNQVLF